MISFLTVIDGDSGIWEGKNWWKSYGLQVIEHIYKINDLKFKTYKYNIHQGFADCEAEICTF